MAYKCSKLVASRNPNPDVLYPAVTLPAKRPHPSLWIKHSTHSCCKAPLCSPRSPGSSDNPAPARAQPALRSKPLFPHTKPCQCSALLLPPEQFGTRGRGAEASSAGSSKALGSLPSPSFRCSKHPKPPIAQSHFVSAPLSHAQSGIRRCSGQGSNHGKSPFCTYPFCSSAVKPLQLPQPLSSRQDRRRLLPSPSSPAVPGQAPLPGVHRTRPQCAGWLPLGRNFTCFKAELWQF